MLSLIDKNVVFLKVEFDPSLGTSASNASSMPSSTFSLQHIGAGGNALMSAASQAIAATQQLSGRRSSRYDLDMSLSMLNANFSKKPAKKIFRLMAGKINLNFY